MEFIIPLTEQKVKPHQVTALHLVVGLALLAWSAITLLINNVVVDAINSEATQGVTIEQSGTLDITGGTVMVISLIIIASALFRNKWLRTATVNIAFRVIELLLLLAISIHLIAIQFNILAAVFGLLAATVVFALFWENGKNKTLTVTITDKGVAPPLSRKNISWPEVESALLRHGALTINCVDNRLYQWVTDTHDINQQEFEAYCLAQIEAGKKHRTNDNW